MDRQDSYIDLLKDKIEELLELAASLKNSNNLLTIELEELRSKQAELTESDAENGRSADLEQEIKQLKKENKSLREKQKLVQNKAERLVTKLNELGL